MAKPSIPDAIQRDIENFKRQLAIVVDSFGHDPDAMAIFVARPRLVEIYSTPAWSAYWAAITPEEMEAIASFDLTASRKLIRNLANQCLKSAQKLREEGHPIFLEFSRIVSPSL